MGHRRSQDGNLPRPNPLALRSTLALIAVASGLLAVVLVVEPWGSGFVQRVDNLGTTVAALVAGVVCLRRSQWTSALRASCLALGAGLLSWGAGQAYWSWSELIAHREVPFPSLADVGFLGFPVAVALALLLFPWGAEASRARLRELLDGLVIATSLLALSCVTVMHAVLATSAESRLALVMSLAYPATDVVVVSMALLALTHAHAEHRLRLLVVAGGLLAMVVADTWFAWGNALGTYTTGELGDLGWSVSFLLLGLVATHPQVGPHRRRRRPSGTRAIGLAGAPGPTVAQLALPYLPLSAASTVFLVRVLQGRPVGTPLAVLGIVLVLLVYVRQVVLLIDNRRLVSAVGVQAFSDPLTGLANRTVFLDRLDRALEDGSGDVAVAFVDLDDFKAVNDACGHAVGDALLVTVAERLRATVGTGALVARLGGDEFAVLLPPSHGEPTVLAEAIVAALARPVDAGGHRLTVTASVGLTRLADAEESATQVLRNADLAMYAAKHSGKGRHAVFDADLGSMLLHDVRLRQEIADALASDQFFLLYQPLYELRTGRLAGAEALVRWAHPNGTMLAPAAFLRQAETSEIMPSLGRVLLTRAGREVREWLDRSGEPDFFVSVNLSALQLTDPTLPAHVAAVLAENRLEPARLLLEVTESALLLDVDGAAAVLAGLAELGVRIALDDFGTGYSSLAHLHRFPVHVLKTDRSFVAGDPPPPASSAGSSFVAPAASGMAGLVAEIGSSLGLVTVGEGVETPEQLQLLRRLGYDLAQGYLLGRPGPLAALRPTLPDLDAGIRPAEPPAHRTPASRTTRP